MKSTWRAEETGGTFRPAGCLEVVGRMSLEDRQRWDEKWRAMAGEPFEPHPLLTRNVTLLTEGKALDLACGRGQNAIWLACQSYEVLGLDISPVALEQARGEADRRGLGQKVRFDCVDLDELSLPAAAYDLICVFRFLNRGLFPAIRTSLRPGGLLFFSTRHIGVLRRCPEANRAYLLQPGELAAEFAGWRLLEASEGSEDAELVARKVGSAE